jgi:hypothetical protein
MKELSIEEKEKAYDGNYKAYIELINRLENMKKKQLDTNFFTVRTKFLKSGRKF